MKKYTGIRINENDVENQTLYVGIEEIYGEWLLTTCGDPTALNECEDAEDADTIDLVNKIIESEKPEDVDEEDVEYVRRWLEIWGIA